MSTGLLFTKQQLKYLTQNSFWVFLSFTVNFLTGLFLSSLFSRIWSPETYGSYSFILSVIGFLSLTTLPGMGQALLQASANHHDSFYYHSIKYLIKRSFLGSIILLFLSLYYFIYQDMSLTLSFGLCALIFPLVTTSNLYVSFLNGKGLFRQSALLIIILQLILSGLVTITLIYIPLLLLITIITFYIPGILSLAINLKLSLKNYTKTDVHKNYLQLAKGLSFSQLFTISADYIDRIITPLLLGFTDFAIYTFATLVPLQIHQLLKTSTSILEPKIASIKDSELDKVFYLRIVILMLATLFIIVVYIISSPFIFDFLYPNYKQSSLFLSQIFSLSLLYYPFNIFALVLVKKHHTPALIKINMFYGFSTIISLIILISGFGLMGAVVSKIISRMIYSIAILFYFVKTIYRQS